VTDVPGGDPPADEPTGPAADPSEAPPWTPSTDPVVPVHRALAALAAEAVATRRNSPITEEDAWRILVDRYQTLVWTTVRRFGLTEEDADDVVQTVFLRLVENLGRIRNPEKIGAWLATTARREALRAMHRASRLDPLSADQPEADVESDLQDRLIESERRKEVRRALQQLPERQAILLRVLTEEPTLSYQDIAVRSGVPLGSIGPTRARALARLRATLEDLDPEFLDLG
jgi:RNA polymerase sigma factor (sigma-70 family)